MACQFELIRRADPMSLAHGLATTAVWPSTTRCSGAMVKADICTSVPPHWQARNSLQTSIAMVCLPDHQPVLGMLGFFTISQLNNMVAQLLLAHNSAVAWLRDISDTDAAQIVKEQQKRWLYVLETLPQARCVELLLLLYQGCLLLEWKVDACASVEWQPKAAQCSSRACGQNSTPWDVASWH